MRRERQSRVLSTTSERVVALLLGVALVLSGCIWQSRINQSPVSERVAEEALYAALDQVGDPYVWGGQGPDEFDCSGLIIWAYAQVLPDLQLRIGHKIVEDATQDELWRYNVQVIPPDQMQPGDIVFITNDPDRMTHGGLFIEWVDDSKTEFRFVNASSYYGQVVIDTWPVQGMKREQWFVGAGRLMVVR